ncbi:MAG: restriction endonuclease [Candidatus Altiarchaeales archaeon IMC4]|nr:MAG: restriction endonuclease [Candidatus Altiarchaeales archaeon IMC4]
MQLRLDTSLAQHYKKQSQKVRVMSEDWAHSEIFCPSCGGGIMDYENNRPVADFYCAKCKEDFELKSKKDKFGKKIANGAYETKIKRLQSDTVPNFFLLNYDLKTLEITNFFVVPKHFFVPAIVEKRKPLSPTSQRAGWVGSNILLWQIPQSGKIFYVKNGEVEDKRTILENWNKTLFLRESKEAELKGWVLDIMNCIDRLNKDEFSLQDVYNFENELSIKHPENKHVKDKIRQQLQFLRDKDYLEFLGRGIYKKV